MSAPAKTVRRGQRVELARSEKIKLAVTQVLQAYASDIDDDTALRMIRLEVRVNQKTGDIRAVIIERSSEFSEP